MRERGVLLDLGDVERLDVRVLISPYLSTLAALVDAVAGVRRGLPRPLATRLVRAVDSDCRRALVPLGQPWCGLIPDVAVPPFSGIADMAMSDALDALRSAAPDVVHTQVMLELGADPAGHWRTVLQAPTAWLDRLASANECAYTHLSPMIRAAEQLFDQEVTRVGTAVVRGCTDTLLATLTPRLGLSRHTLRYDHEQPGRYVLEGRTLVLAPIISGPGMLLTNFDIEDRAYICYPIRRPRAGHGEEPNRRNTKPTALDSLLGGSSARALRRLEMPVSMQQLAHAICLAPSSTTEQCDRLERAGLVSRERRGRQVFAQRTARGDRLVALMDGD